MVPLEDFELEVFDPKACVNRIVEGCVDGDANLDRLLTEEEMRLHVAAEDLNTYLHEETLRTSARMPSAARDLVKIELEMKNIRDYLDVAMDSMPETVAEDGCVGLEQLFRLNIIVKNLEQARDTLKEATGLSALISRIDQMMLPKARDLDDLIQCLHALQRGLSIVGDSLPDFQDAPEKLHKLEKKALDMATEQLHSAIKNQQGEDASHLHGLLVKLERTDVFVEQFTSTRNTFLMILWDSFKAGTPFVPWLSTFYEELMRSIRSECEWMKKYVPSEFPYAVHGLFEVFFSRTATSCKVRLSGATSQTNSITLLKSIEVIENSVQTTGDFVDAFRNLLVDEGLFESHTDPKLHSFVRLAVQPYDEALERYAEKESNLLSFQIDEITSKLKKILVANHSTELSSEKMFQDNFNDAFTILYEGIVRCMRTTQGTSLGSVLDAMDTVMSSYVRSVNTFMVSSQFKKINEESAAKDKCHQAIDVLFLCSVVLFGKKKLNSFINFISTTVQQEMRELFEFCQEINTSGRNLDEALSRSRGTAYLAIGRAANGNIDSDFIQEAFVENRTWMNKTSKNLDLLQGSIDHEIESLFTERLISLLAEVSQFDEFDTTEKAESTDFATYPRQYIITSGEYLMMMPHLLQTKYDDEIHSELVSQWIDRISSRAIEIYHNCIRELGQLSEGKNAQLQADIEYFCNILNSLGQEIPRNFLEICFN